jgi:hypothetical protein
MNKAQDTSGLNRDCVALHGRVRMSRGLVFVCMRLGSPTPLSSISINRTADTPRRRAEPVSVTARARAVRGVFPPPPSPPHTHADMREPTRV